MLKLSNYASIEGIVILTNHLSVIYTSCSSSAPKYELATLNLVLCIIYLLCFCASRNNKTTRSIYFTPILLFAISVIISSIELTPEFYNTNFIGLFSYSLFGVSTYFINYIYLHRNRLDEELIKNYAYASIFLGAITAYYFYTRTVMVLDLKSEDGQNFFYHFLIPMPLLFCFLNDKKKLIIYIIVFFGVLLSFKRSAFIVIILVGGFLIRNLLHRKNHELKNKWGLLLLAIIAFVMTFYFLGFEKLDVILGRLEDIEEDKGSGRLNISELFFDYLPNYEVYEYFFGHGYGGFARKFVRYNSAHNDFIEVFFAHGILGLLSILTIITRTIKNTIKYKTTKTFVPLVTLSVFFVVFGMVSSLFHYYEYSLPLFIMLAYIDYLILTQKINEQRI